MHSSRKCKDWIEVCRKNRSEAVVAPANTSHFLQPCDQNINRRFKNSLRTIRGAFCRCGLTDTRQINFNLACWVHGCASITPADINAAFEKTGTFPVDNNFADRFKRRTQWKNEKTSHLAENPSFDSSLQVVKQRQADQNVWSEAMSIISSRLGPATKIQKLTILLKYAETVNVVLMRRGSSPSALTAPSRTAPNNVPLNAGVRAECVTVGEAFERRLKREADEMHREM